jgi:hypothetical protein
VPASTPSTARRAISTCSSITSRTSDRSSSMRPRRCREQGWPSRRSRPRSAPCSTLTISSAPWRTFDRLFVSSFMSASTAIADSSAWPRHSWASRSNAGSCATVSWMRCAPAGQQREPLGLGDRLDLARVEPLEQLVFQLALDGVARVGPREPACRAVQVQRPQRHVVDDALHRRLRIPSPSPELTARDLGVKPWISAAASLITAFARLPADFARCVRGTDHAIVHDLRVGCARRSA